MMAIHDIEQHMVGLVIEVVERNRHPVFLDPQYVGRQTAVGYL
jgi:hypothetical protein